MLVTPTLLEIPVGTYFTGSIGGVSSHGLFVRTYSNIVLLSNPRNTWEEGNRSRVHDYTVVDVSIHHQPSEAK